MPRTSNKAELIVEFVNQFVQENGFAPSVREIGAAVGLRSTASVSYHLQQLKARGDCLNVLTASPHMTLDPCLKRLELFELFDNVWSCDDFSTTKADVNIYKMAAEKIGVPVEEVLFLDDNFNADKTAVEAGMKV